MGEVRGRAGPGAEGGQSHGQGAVCTCASPEGGEVRVPIWEDDFPCVGAMLGGSGGGGADWKQEDLQKSTGILHLVLFFE